MLDTSKIQPYVLKVLESHGWYKERVYDISYWLEMLSKEGYICFDYAEKILKSLGNIYVRTDGDGEHMGSQFDFNAYGAGSGEFDRLHDYETAAQESLFPIGMLFQGFVYAGKNKNIYWGDQHSLFLMGPSIEAYLNGIFDKKSKPIKLNFFNS